MEIMFNNAGHILMHVRTETHGMVRLLNTTRINIQIGDVANMVRC